MNKEKELNYQVFEFINPESDTLEELKKYKYLVLVKFPTDDSYVLNMIFHSAEINLVIDFIKYDICFQCNFVENNPLLYYCCTNSEYPKKNYSVAKALYEVAEGLRYSAGSDVRLTIGFNDKPKYYIDIFRIDEE